jgi:hypothetical protein
VTGVGGNSSAYRSNGARLPWRWLPASYDRADMVGLGHCADWSDVLVALTHFAPPKVTVGRDIITLPKHR